MTGTFTHAGVSRLNGVIKPRFANDITRVKVLEKNGHTEIDLVELKYAMTKEEAVKSLIEAGWAGDRTEVSAALAAYVAKGQPKAPAMITDAEGNLVPAPAKKRGRKSNAEKAAIAAAAAAAAAGEAPSTEGEAPSTEEVVAEAIAA